MATLTTLAASSPIERVKLLSEEDWSQLRNLCGAVAVSPR
jgi:hypothetical protein